MAMELLVKRRASGNLLGRAAKVGGDIIVAALPGWQWGAGESARHMIVTYVDDGTRPTPARQIMQEVEAELVALQAAGKTPVLTNPVAFFDADNELITESGVFVVVASLPGNIQADFNNVNVPLRRIASNEYAIATRPQVLQPGAHR